MSKVLSTMIYIFNTDISTLMYGEERNSSSILNPTTDTSAKLKEKCQKTRRNCDICWRFDVTLHSTR